MSPSSRGRIRYFFRLRFAAFREINRKYAHPRIRQTRTVRFALGALFLYLLVLLGIFLVKFITLALA
ncbi:MAG: hypothetical protein WCS85_01840 [Candidatus Peribacteraceae bacterium]|jgi:hypothetical protein